MGSGPEDIRDEELEREIVLLGELMAAAAGVDGHLTQARVDEALGVTHPGADHEKPADD